MFKITIFSVISKLENAEEVRDQPSLTEANIQEFALTMNDFTQALLVEMWSEGDNFVFSPFSLHSALAILTSGATQNTTTEKELLGALGRVRNVQALENRYKALINDYRNTNVSTMLSYGNAFWTDKKYYDKLESLFLERLSYTYDVDVRVLGANPVKDVNDWVSNVTKEKITKIIGILNKSSIESNVKTLSFLDMIPPTLSFLIVNALYFKASWSVAFEDVPESQNFTTTEGKTVKALMMRRDFSYAFTAAVFESSLLRQGFNKMLVLSIPYEVKHTTKSPQCIQKLKSSHLISSTIWAKGSR